MSELLVANTAMVQQHQAAEERAWLLRFCTMLARNQDDAEDLAQETLVEAWRNAAKVYDPQGRRAWLAAIARNVHLRWQRRQARQVSHTFSLTTLTEPESNALPADNADPLADLEQAERAHLLDRALGYVPPATRAALIGHYVEDRSQRELAARLHINEAAVAARLQRGKAILRNVLAGELRDEARVFGWGADGWQETRIWCPLCGERRFQGMLDPRVYTLRLRCPTCNGTLDFINHRTPIIAGVKTFKAALTRLMDWADAYYQGVIHDCVARCIACGKPAPYSIASDHVSLSGRKTATLTVHCACQVQNMGDSVGLALYTPMGRQFLRRYERMRLLPTQSVDMQGVPAQLVSFASRDETARLDVAFEAATMRVLHANITHA